MTKKKRTLNELRQVKTFGYINPSAKDKKEINEAIAEELRARKQMDAYDQMLASNVNGWSDVVEKIITKIDNMSDKIDKIITAVDNMK